MEEGITMSKAKAFKDLISPEIPWKEGFKCLKLWPMGLIKLDTMAKKSKIFGKRLEYSHVKKYLAVIGIWKYKHLLERGALIHLN